MQRRPAPSKFRKTPHLYAPDGVPDFQGYDRCRECGLGKVHFLHNLPAAPAEATARDRAVLGESGDDE